MVFWFNVPAVGTLLAASDSVVNVLIEEAYIEHLLPTCEVSICEVGRTQQAVPYERDGLIFAVVIHGQKIIPRGKQE